MYLQRLIPALDLVISIIILIDYSKSSQSSPLTLERNLNKKYDAIEQKLYEVLPGEQCYRKCSFPAVPKICTFEFKLEWWTTMNPACGDCPIVKEDCYAFGCIPAEGTQRLLQVINKQLPGPAIHVCEYDYVRVELRNNLQHGTETSIHWHGLHQRGSQFMDGMPYFSQCPVDYKGSFLYEFQAFPAGTHFYHSHSGLQAGDGIYGTMIVRQPREEDVLSSYYDQDLAEHSMVVHSWWPQTNEYTFLLTMSNLDLTLVEKPVAILVNGRAANSTLRYVENSTFYDNDLPLAEFTVEQGLRYRFRVVHGGIKNCPLRVALDRHRMTVIASDSGSLEPIIVDVIQILPGERYDFVVYANQPVNSYFVIISGVVRSGCAPLKGYGILNYKGFDPWLEPIEPEVKMFPLLLNTYNDDVDQLYLERILFSSLKSITKNTGVLGVPQHTIYMEVESTSAELVNDYGVIPFALINDISFKEPSRPFWFKTEYTDTSEYCNIESLQKQGVVCTTEEICQCTHVYQIGLGDLVEIVVLANDQNSEHPMHLHGNEFSVVSMGFLKENEGDTNTLIERFKLADSAGMIERNLDQPPVKDTIGVPESGYTVIRFFADNPGWWPFHCHTDVHNELGMMVGLIVGNKEDLPKAPIDYPQCGSWFNQ